MKRVCTQFSGFLILQLKVVLVLKYWTRLRTHLPPLTCTHTYTHIMQVRLVVKAGGFGEVAAELDYELPSLKRRLRGALLYIAYTCLEGIKRHPWNGPTVCCQFHTSRGTQPGSASVVGLRMQVFNEITGNYSQDKGSFNLLFQSCLAVRV